MAKAKKARKAEPSQKERFIAAAVKAGGDECRKDFERAFKKIVPRKRSRKTCP